MEINLTEERQQEILSHFRLEGTLLGIRTFGNGHINDTYLLEFDTEDPTMQKVVLQKINKYVFHHPDEVMENIVGVTSWLRRGILEKGGDPDREALNVILTSPDAEGNAYPYYEDSEGEFWRITKFIPGTVSYDLVEKPEDFYESAYAFGNFQRMLSDYPANTLHETIKGFHDTRARFAVFKQAVKEDVKGRAASVQKEIQFILDREEVANCFSELLDQGALPLRVTHNDTKLNNIMMDKVTRKGVCVIDLDTVMPGLAMNDFGDAIRFGASTAVEDETDLDKVSMDLGLYEIYTRGFLEGCGGRLTEQEIRLLPMGAKVMTYEVGMRFLTDYLQGDVYFRIHREHHNLDRARTQLKLVADMEQKWDQMMAIVEKYC